MSRARFQVDLGGLIALLSEHLYSGPQVFLRELLQNGVDALAERTVTDPDFAGEVRIWVEDADGTPTLTVRDTGIGLTADQANTLLATIGASSKRDPLTTRADYIGRFGVGMLAAFLVSDEIEVTSRSAEPGSRLISWIGRSTGEFDLTETDTEHPIGTSVQLRAKRGCEHWFDEDTLVALARDYGEILPADVAVQVTDDRGRQHWRRVSAAAPWLAAPGPQRSATLTAYSERIFGFTPLTFIDLALPAAGLTGVAFVLPQAVAPSPGSSRVYVKDMLIGARVDHVLPDWAFFVRAVLTATALTPAASREQLKRDDVLAATQEALGVQLKAWIITTLQAGGPVAEEFIRVHHLALRALAATDDEMLDLVADVLPFDTTSGPSTLRAAAPTGDLLFAATLEAYRRIAPVARAQGLTVVNAGYVYDADIMERLARRRGWQARPITSEDLTQILSRITAERELQTAAVIVQARATLARDDCDVILREFDPDHVPALLLRDRESEHRRALSGERQASPERWSDLLGSFDTGPGQRTRTLVLNDRSPSVRQLLTLDDPVVFGAALRATYLSALLLAGEGLGTADVSSLHEALATLVTAATANHRKDLT